MARETHSDKISTLEKLTSSLSAQVENQEKKLDELAQRSRDMEHLVHELDKNLPLFIGEVKKLKEDLNDLRTKRWEIWKIILTAVLSSALGLLVGRFLK